MPAPVGSRSRPRPRTVSAASPPSPAAVRSTPGGAATGPSSAWPSNRGLRIDSAPVTSPTPSAQAWWASRIAAPRPSGSAAPTIRHIGRSRGNGIAASRPISASRSSPPRPSARASTTCQSQSGSPAGAHRHLPSTERRVNFWSKWGSSGSASRSTSRSAAIDGGASRCTAPPTTCGESGVSTCRKNASAGGTGTEPAGGRPTAATHSAARTNPATASST